MLTSVSNEKVSGVNSKKLDNIDYYEICKKFLKLVVCMHVIYTNHRHERLCQTLLIPQ